MESAYYLDSYSVYPELVMLQHHPSTLLVFLELLFYKLGLNLGRKVLCLVGRSGYHCHAGADLRNRSPFSPALVGDKRTKWALFCAGAGSYIVLATILNCTRMCT